MNARKMSAAGAATLVGRVLALAASTASAYPPYYGHHWGPRYYVGDPHHGPHVVYRYAPPPVVVTPYYGYYGYPSPYPYYGYPTPYYSSPYPSFYLQIR